MTKTTRTEAAFARLLEAPIDALMVVDGQGMIQMLNSHLEKMFGYRRHELLGKHVNMLLPERYRQNHQTHHGNYFSQPKARPMGTGLELLALHQDGHEFPVEISLTPLEAEETVLVSAAIRDISERKLTERALQESEKRMAFHLNHTPLAIIEWHVTDLKISAWNPAAEKIFGYRAKDVLDTPITECIIPAGDPKDLEAIWKGEVAAEGLRFTSHNLTKEGRTIICEWYATPIRNEHNELVQVAAHALDVTSRQRALEALFTAQEEERARISRDLHDQVGQSLTALLLGLNAALDKPQRERLEQLKELTAQTLEDVRLISRALRPALLDELGLEAAISRFARELASQSGLTIDVLVRAPTRLDKPVEIVVYRVAQEALTNVVRHAQANHASVIVTAGTERIQLIVEDDGIGFDAQRFAGTEHLGVAGMRERLELVGGSLRIESTPGRGTIISARLPVHV